MSYESAINYYEMKKQRLKAIEVKNKFTPKPAIYLERGVRGIDIAPTITMRRKCSYDEIVKMYLDGKSAQEIADYFRVTNQNVSYYISKYKKKNE